MASSTETARRRPHYAFVLIGDCKVDASELRRADNVHLLTKIETKEATFVPEASYVPEGTF